MTRPSRLLLALETRALPELGLFLAAAPTMLACMPKGEDRPVLVLPGFLASDRSTAPLRWALGRLGYASHGWDVGQNLGPTDETLEGITDKIVELRDTYGQPVSLVGWSLGGVYAREMARLAPDYIRDVVTLGSPFQIQDSANSNASAFSNRLQDTWSDNVQLPRVPDWLRETLPVPSTAVYTKTDGVVQWSDCVDTADARHDNVEVYGSHCGLGHNMSALLVVADRLAQAPGLWQAFEPPRAFAHLFPPASRAGARSEPASGIAA